ncbi:proton transporter [Legionella nautarum]|uniref:Proton transporter n=1 Tax=Legionella nautarum TaxID=45070 RepID=A0A0W0WW25_9GAMM|nr:exopolysaccharide biosynthesis protein [Legionella nautarum]KTD36506.1 proton transporter [Legionella nautarum]
MTKHTGIAALFKQLLKKHEQDASITYEELVRSIGPQAYGLIIILFALPSALPISVVPGISFIFGLPIVFIALHIIIAKPNLWLPTRLANRKIETKKLATVINKTLPYLVSIEHLLKPRWLFFTSSAMERLHGVVLLGLSFLLLLPIPFSNFIFASIIILFGLGISEEDGLVIVLAYLGSFAYALFLTKLTREVFRWFGA